MWQSPRPPVSEVSDCEYVRMSAIGTSALMLVMPPSGSIPCRRPRRELRSPLTAPTVSSGTTTSSSMIGSSSTGSAFSYACRNAIEPAILNAISEESTVWYEPSTSDNRTPCTRAATKVPVLFGEAAQARRHLLLVALRLRRDRERHHGLGQAQLGELDLDLPVEQQIAGRDLLQLRDGADVARAERLSILVILALELEQRADALLRVRPRVDERRVARDLARQHAEDVDAPRERVGDRLEHERGGACAVDVDRGALLRRRRDALHEQVEQRARPEVLSRDRAGDREDLAPRDRVLERMGDLVDRQLLAVEVPLHQRLVDLDDLVEELLAVLGHLVCQRGGNRLRIALALPVGARVGAHVDEVDDPRQLVLGADRELDDDAALRELLAHRVEILEEV